MDQHTVHLAAEDDVEGFRRAVRRLVAEAVAPERVSWQVASAAVGDLFADAASAIHATSVDSAAEAPVDAAPALRLPAFFADLCLHAALHAAPGRFGLLYRLAWRLLHEPGLRHDPLDADRIEADQMARAVRRDMHKMTAFVRFRPLVAAMASMGSCDPTDGAWPITHVAWFEPVHHIVQAAAPFFARRFAQMPWAILTPERSVRWDGQRLAFGAGAQRSDAPTADAGEKLWLTYYQNIFNPARLKLAMMQKEMPRRYWKNLPEAVLIQPLAAQAAPRSGQMIAQGGSEPLRRRPAASHRLTLTARPADAPPFHAAALQPLQALQALRQATERCRACPIGAFATQAVPGEGALHARLMLVGEQPGDQEDLHGRPFVGPAGQLLDRALGQLGWSREALYLTNAVKHFKFEPRGKRRIHQSPGQREAAACQHWLEEEIALVRPAAAIALGATAARSLLGRPVAVGRERGVWLARAEDGLPVLVTLHPAALLRLAPGLFDAALASWLADLRLASSHAVGHVAI